MKYYNHLVSIIFPDLLLSEAKKDPNLYAIDQKIQLHCSCPAFQMWGSAYWATQNGYNISQFKENRRPNKRDPKEKRFICKHVYAVGKEIWNDTLFRIYNRFSRSYYRKKEKQRKDRNLKRRKIARSELAILRFILEYLTTQKNFSYQDSLIFLKKLADNNLIEDFLEKENLITYQ